MRDTSGDLDPVGVGLAHGDQDGDVNVYRGTNGRVILAPAAYRRLKGDALASVQDVQEAAAAISEWQQALEESVAAAREEGVSWDLIGWSVGTTGNAARQRWGVPR